MQIQAQGQQNHWDDLLKLEFPGYYLTEKSAARMHAEIDFQRACQTYLWALPAMNMYSMREGSEREFGKGNHILPVWKGRLRAKAKITTPNSDVIYALSYLDLKDGPVVVEAPAGIQGLFDDFWQRPITDVGLPGPDQGKGGKYLLLPPDYEGPLSEDMWYRTEPDGSEDLYYTFRSRTYGVFLFWRAFLGDGGSTEEGVKIIEQTKVYPWGKKDSAPKMQFPDATEVDVQMLIPNVTKGDNPYRYFENLAKFINYEFVEEKEFAMRGMLATLGIIKGKPFKPDARLKDILTKASEVAYNMSRANRYASRIPKVKIYPDRQWEQCYIGERADFLEDTYLNLDARAAFFHFAYSASEAMVKHLVNKGAKYPTTFRDADGAYLMGENSYKMHIPANPPATIFWSVAIYGAFDASGLDNGQTFPSINSKDKIVFNKDGSADLYFGPELPEGAPKSNWMKTIPKDGFFVMYRFYGTMKPYYDQTWKPDDLVKLK
jgi:hypothetical protein